MTGGCDDLKGASGVAGPGADMFVEIAVGENSDTVLKDLKTQIDSNTLVVGDFITFYPNR
jgi:hypothetical protein